MSSYDLMKTFTSENKQILLIYFLINIFTFSLESVGLSHVLGEMFDKFGSKTSNPQTIKRLVIAVVAIFIAIKIGYIVKRFYYNNIIPKFNKYIREHLFKCILNRYKIYYQELRLGHVLSNFYDLPIALYTLVEKILSEYIPNTIALLVAVGFLMYLNPTIGMIALAGVAVIALIIYFSIKRGVDLSSQEYNTYQSNNEFIQDRLGNLFNIYASNAESTEFKEYSKIEEKLETDWGNSYKYNSYVSAAISLVVSVVFATVLYLLYNMYKKKSNRSSTLITIILVMTYYTNYISSIAHNFAHVVDLAGAIRQCDKFLAELKEPETDKNRQGPIKISDGEIVFKDVTFKYPKPSDSSGNTGASAGDEVRGGGNGSETDGKGSETDGNGSETDGKGSETDTKGTDTNGNETDTNGSETNGSETNGSETNGNETDGNGNETDGTNGDKLTDGYILKDASLVIRPKTIIAIYGQSGSGKTTILKLILGFYGLEKGSINIDNQNVSTVDVEDLRRNISTADQNVQLFDKSVIDNIAYGSQASRQDVLNMMDKFNVNHIYAGLKNGLNTLTGPNGMNLSRGQRQVIIILRSMLKNSKILLLDEPTSALDKKTKALVLNIIGKIDDRTVIIITHDRDVLNYSHINYTLSNGKLVELPPDKKSESKTAPQEQRQEPPQTGGFGFYRPNFERY